MKRICMAALVSLTVAAGLGAQVMSSKDAPEPKPKAVASGPLSPYFWIGGKTVLTAGRNWETGASGLSFTDTWGSFNFALIDSRYDIPKRLGVGEDPATWSGFFSLKNPTTRLNSWTSTPEMNWPSWQAGIQGQGIKAGVLSQGDTPVPGGDTANLPAPSALLVTGANRAAVLGARTAGDNPFLTATETLVTVAYPVNALAYAGWEAPDRAKIALTVGSRGNATNGNNGWVGALNLEATPLGTVSLDNPIAWKVQANAVAGIGYPDTVNQDTQDGNPMGTGVGAQVDFFVDDDLIISPLAAFDLRLNDTATPGVALPTGTLKTEWKASAGVLVTLSPKRWTSDDYSELPAQGAGYQNFEYTKIQKFSYFQILADYARAALADKQKDVDLVVRFEEPDGLVGLDENLGLLVEFTKTNVLEANPGQKSDWALAGRVSYDLLSHRYTPYLRAFTDSNRVLKLRTGLQFSLIPGCAIELAYLSPNLSKDTVTNTAYNAGRLELTVGLSSDSGYTRTAKNMNFQ